MDRTEFSVGTTAPETHELEFESDKVRLVRVHYGPGQKAPMHDHPDQVQIWLTDAEIPITMSEGGTQVDHVKAGLARWRNALSHKAEKSAINRSSMFR